MNIIVTLEYRFKRLPDGSVWTEMSFQYDFWKRYLNVYENVLVVARILEVQSLSGTHHRVDGDNVTILGLPYYHGPREFLTKKNLISKQLDSIINKYQNEAIIMRVGSPIADLLQTKLRKTNRPYGLEVVGDPWDVFSPGAFSNPLRPLMRLYFTLKLKKQCKAASTLSYVTNKSLQERYPGKTGAYTIGASSIALEDSHIIESPKKFESDHAIFNFIYVGTLEQLQKAPDILIKACNLLKNENANFKLKIIGEGKYKPMLVDMVKKFGLQDNVEFLGMVPAGDKIREYLDLSDVFVLPSRGEGLPRAMIEAMARALPCIGSNIGGIRELISSDDIVEINDEVSLFKKMKEFMNDPVKLNEKSANNLNTSKEFHLDILTQRRFKFYSHLRDITSKWNNE